MATVKRNPFSILLKIKPLDPGQVEMPQFSKIHRLI
jgi:hypothetical protein